MQKPPTKLILAVLILVLLLLCFLLPRCREKNETRQIRKAEAEQKTKPIDPETLPNKAEKKESIKIDARKAMRSLGSKMSKLRDGAIEKTKLTEEDILSYIRVYKRLAEISPQLEKSKSQNKAPSIFLCKECRSLLDQTVKEEGYLNFATFLIMDARMHYTMQAVASIRMAEILGETATGISVDELIAKPERITELNQQDHKNLGRLLSQVSALQNHIKRMGAMAQKWAGSALDQGDLALVSKHFDEIFSAWENNGLPSELKHTESSHDWDD